jgi:hypothetical protein
MGDNDMMKGFQMNTRFLFIGLLLILLAVIVDVTSHPKPAHAQAIGYVQSGQQAVTANAVVVSGISYGTVCIKALAGNTINVYLGGPGVTDSTGMELAPGNAYCAPAVNVNPFYVIASTTGASVSWIVSR